MFDPVLPGMIFGLPSTTYEAHVFVVPRSMPMMMPVRRTVSGSICGARLVVLHGFIDVLARVAAGSLSSRRLAARR